MIHNPPTHYSPPPPQVTVRLPNPCNVMSCVPSARPPPTEGLHTATHRNSDRVLPGGYQMCSHGGHSHAVSPVCIGVRGVGGVRGLTGRCLQRGSLVVVVVLFECVIGCQTRQLFCTVLHATDTVRGWGTWHAARSMLHVPSFTWHAELFRCCRRHAARSMLHVPSFTWHAELFRCCFPKWKWRAMGRRGSVSRILRYSFWRGRKPKRRARE